MVLDPQLELHKTDLLVSDVAADWQNYANWGTAVKDEMTKYEWR